MNKRRSSDEIKQLVLSLASQDVRIRAVLLNGSRANSAIPEDPYQDFDIVFLVNEIESFMQEPSWHHVFGEKIIQQIPEEMSFGNENAGPGFSTLMLFSDTNRIDLTLFPLTHYPDGFRQDSLTIVWLDKDDIVSSIRLPDDTDYHIKRPSEKLFLDTCNEFWWVATYVGKGLMREQVIYAKHMLETVVRPMFFNMASWYIGTETGFAISLGQHGKFMSKYLPPSLYTRLLSTYPDHQISNIWRSLFSMMDLFCEFGVVVADRLGFAFNLVEAMNVNLHLLEMYERNRS
jgi:aminoglycoside 6-adenylyltransferase